MTNHRYSTHSANKAAREVGEGVGVGRQADLANSIMAQTDRQRVRERPGSERGRQVSKQPEEINRRASGKRRPDDPGGI